MSESTVTTRYKGVEAAERHRRVATIEDVCSPVIRVASTTYAHCFRADETATGARSRLVRGATMCAGISGATRSGAVTAR